MEISLPSPLLAPPATERDLGEARTHSRIGGFRPSPRTPQRARVAAPNIPRPFSKKPSAPPPRSANKRDPHWAQKMRT